MFLIQRYFLIVDTFLYAKFYGNRFTALDNRLTALDNHLMVLDNRVTALENRFALLHSLNHAMYVDYYKYPNKSMKLINK